MEEIGCRSNNIDPWRRVYLTEQIPAVPRLSYSSQCPMQMPRHNQMQQHDAFITLSIILIQRYWNKAKQRPVIELKKTLSAAGNFSLTRKPYADQSPSLWGVSGSLYLSEKYVRQKQWFNKNEFYAIILGKAFSFKKLIELLFCKNK